MKVYQNDDRSAEKSCQFFLSLEYKKLNIQFQNDFSDNRGKLVKLY